MFAELCFSGAPLAGGYFDSEDVPAPEPGPPPEPAPVVKRGGPTKFNEVVRETILEAVRNGASLYASARAAGVTGPCLSNWLADPRPEFVEFKEQVDQARAVAFTACERMVKTAKPLDWLMRGPGRLFTEPDAQDKPMPAWVDPAQKIESRNMNLNGNVTIPSTVDTRNLSLEDLEKLEAILIKAQAPPVPAPLEITDGNNGLTVEPAIPHDPDADESED